VDVLYNWFLELADELKEVNDLNLHQLALKYKNETFTV
jgi:hypothetical protein